MIEAIPWGPDSVGARLVRSLGPFGFVAVDTDRVNLDDLVRGYGREGAIVRCYGDPRSCIAVFCAPESETLGCVAGWISED